MRVGLWLACVAIAGMCVPVIPQEQRLAVVTGEIVDHDTARPLPARIYIRGENGAWHFPRSQAADGSAVFYRKQRPDNPRCVEMHTTLSAHPFTVNLPPGKYAITVERGHEYLPETRQITVGKKDVHVGIKLRRWIDMAGRGWYSGETHVHRSLDELPNVMLAEDLNVAFPLHYWVTEAFTPPRMGTKSSKEKDPGAKVIRVDATHLIYPRNTEYELFTVGKKRHTLGAFFVIHHKTVFEKGAPPVRPIAQLAHAEGALIELDKPNWPWSMMLIALMGVDLYELANNHVWRTEFGFPNFGEPAPEYMKIERDLKGFTEWGWLDFNFQNYYALLNSGFRLRPTAGTASGVHPVPLGFGRAYVQLDKELTVENWLKGLNAGRSFITTGPMLFVEVDGQAPGTTIRQADAKRREHRVRGSVASARPLQRIEIVVNGEIAKTLKPDNRAVKSGGYESAIDAKIEHDGSCWIAARCFEDRADQRIRFAHSSPVHIDVAGKPLRPRRAEIEFLVKRVADQLERNRGVLPEAALAEYRQALKVYQEIAKTAR